MNDTPPRGHRLRAHPTGLRFARSERSRHPGFRYAASGLRLSFCLIQALIEPVDEVVHKGVGAVVESAFRADFVMVMQD